MRQRALLQPGPEAVRSSAQLFTAVIRQPRPAFRQIGLQQALPQGRTTREDVCKKLFVHQASPCLPLSSLPRPQGLHGRAATGQQTATIDPAAHAQGQKHGRHGQHLQQQGGRYGPPAESSGDGSFVSGTVTLSRTGTSITLTLSYLSEATAPATSSLISGTRLTTGESRV